MAYAVRLFGDEHKSVSKSENALQSNHVISVLQDPENNIIKGEIHGSQNKSIIIVI